ncbi:MAG: ATP-binding cassette domain-containing protein [Anaerolineales bacterium]|nr:ATP-binding cassette domain-containing protein [Anaerolineales bacterium]
MNENVPTNLAIDAKDLTKRYSEDVLAVDGVNLSIPANIIYALLGPNGAGKTTTISMLTTLIKPSGGSAKVTGLDVVKQADEVRHKIGVTFQEIVLDPDLTGRESLDFHGRLYNLSKSQRQAKIDELLNLVELEEAADRRTNTYSGGMKRRLELARGLMTEPEVLFLDEPTQGLDPQNRTNIWEYIRNLKEKQGMTLLLTTHYMDEAEALADRVAILDYGRIVVEGTPQELVNQMGAEVFLISGEGNQDEFINRVQALSFVKEAISSNGMIQISVGSGASRLIEIIKTAQETSFNVEDVSVSKPSLGDVFLKHTGRQLRDK